jgi:hypothetical protein
LGGDHVACEYHEANYLNGMRQEDADRVEGSREKLLAVKVRVPDLLIEAARKRDANGLWAGSLGLVAGSFTPGDVAFFFEMDQYHLGTDIWYGSNMDANPKFVPGGLSDWIEAVGHFEKEIVIGTLARTKAALPKAVFAQLTADAAGGGEYHWAYFNVVGHRGALPPARGDRPARGHGPLGGVPQGRGPDGASGHPVRHR